jgi:hypothetical protein
MSNAVWLGGSGLLCAAFGAWFIGRQYRGHAGTRAGWGAIAFALGLIIRAAGLLAGSRQPLGFILAICFAVSNIGGAILLVSDRDTFRSSRAGGKRRKLPPLRP